ncbi:magnesium transporter [Paenibacillus sp. Marseille-Q4541]|uniref:magnesium transporter n=1 Tax=Paenibacillus sp. Marseille-Q4541 TaxID=2831522 RepID=UPI001BAD6B33|nr:magnesium transporter [Paenibacillus sp. Marseille-Q4541]
MRELEKRSREDELTELTLSIEESIKVGRITEMREEFVEWEPYDLAVVYKELGEAYRPQFMNALEIETLAGMLSELSPMVEVNALYILSKERAAQVLNRMDNDDLADLMGEIPDEMREYMLSIMEVTERETVRELMNFGPETAGGIMTNRYVWFYARYSVREAVEKVKHFADLTNDIQDLYVLNEQKELIGLTTYRDLVLAQDTEIIENLMRENVVKVPADMDQEEVAHLFEQYDLVSMPVEDPQGKLIGVVTFDDVLDVLRAEANEDINKLSATDKTIDFNTHPLTAAKRRLPWLIMLLFLGLLSGSIISIFEGTVSQVVALTFFMPMIAGMTGNTGTQSLAVVIRGLGPQTKMNRSTISRLMWRELLVGVTIGVVCGISVALVAGFWQMSFALGAVIGFSLLLTIIIGTMAGTIIPIILYKLKVDPAVASGPLITTLNDLFSLSVYFGTATVFISYLT